MKNESDVMRAVLGHTIEVSADVFSGENVDQNASFRNEGGVFFSAQE